MKAQEQREKISAIDAQLKNIGRAVRDREPAAGVAEMETLGPGRATAGAEAPKDEVRPKWHFLRHGQLT